jgi:hypothetical protein
MKTLLGSGLLAALLILPQHALGAEAADDAQPDAQRTKQELTTMLQHYPPALHDVLALDPTLLGNEAYLAPYPDLIKYLAAHPEIARDPSFYVEEFRRTPPPDSASRVMDVWRDVLQGVAVFTAFGMAIGLIIWLTRTFIDSRRWSRIAKVQTEVHTKLLDRFSNNEDLLAYIQSPAGSRFLQSAPILLDPPQQRSVGAPLGRILWSIQGGIVVLAGGIGLLFVSARAGIAEAAQPLHALGVLAIALGLGFLAAAGISYVISLRLGLIEAPPPQEVRADSPLA